MRNILPITSWPDLVPGLVDTEGVRDHVAKARRVDLPHVKFFDTAFEKAFLKAGGVRGSADEVSGWRCKYRI